MKRRTARIVCVHMLTITLILYMYYHYYYWGEPERAPHVREVQRARLYIYIFRFRPRVQNGQDGRPLRSRCVRLKYSPRITSNKKEIVRNKAPRHLPLSIRNSAVPPLNLHTNMAQSKCYCIRHPVVKHLGVQGPPLHVMLAHGAHQYDPEEWQRKCLMM